MKSVIVYYKKTITINETELEKKNVVRIILSKGIQTECWVFVFCVFWISLHTFMQNDPANETHQHL